MFTAIFKHVTNKKPSGDDVREDENSCGEVADDSEDENSSEKVIDNCDDEYSCGKLVVESDKSEEENITAEVISGSGDDKLLRLKGNILYSCL